MTTLLAIETSTDLASVALLHQGQIKSLELDQVATHSAGILPAIQQLLAEAGISLAQCNALAFGCGPGAFTGLRTATGIIQGLAFAADLPVIPVITLQAMAQAALVRADAAAQASTDFLCLLDARMNEVYSAVFRYHHEQVSWQEIQAPRLSALSDISLAEMAAATLVVYGRGVAADSLGAQHQIELMPHARDVATLAQQQWLAGHTVRAEQAQPLYLRNKIALTTQERLQQQSA